MRDREGVEFLQWALPRLGMRWPGFRRPRRQVLRRVRGRVAELGLEGLEAYREHLERRQGEWDALRLLCRVTISRWFRDREVWSRLGERLVELAGERTAAGSTEQGGGPIPLAAWSAGCASGEEPWSLRLLWDLGLAQRCPGGSLRILGTDVDPEVLERARRGCYGERSVADVPQAWRETAFQRTEEGLCLERRFRHGVTFRALDVTEEPPAGPFDLVLCRNLVYTYFGEKTQLEASARIATRVRPGGLLMVGSNESLPSSSRGTPFERLERCLYRRRPTPAGGS